MMKKSSIFMIVYIVFLFFSIYMSNDEHLTKIALGATLAGMFFACSDMFLNPAQYFGTQLDRIKKSLLELKNDLSNYTDEEKSKATKYDDWMQELQDNEAFLDKSYKKVKRMRVAGYISFAIGIFVFLTIMTFYNADSKPFEVLLKNENEITIVAFAVVVSNYAVQDWLFAKHQKEIEAFESIEEEQTNG